MVRPFREGQKKKSRSDGDGKRHGQTMREFMEFLGRRAKLNIAAITSRDIARFRDPDTRLASRRRR